MAKRSAVLAAMSMALPVAARATTYHVPGDYPTIAAANAVTVPGDTILIAPGVHTEPAFVPLRSGTRLIGDGSAQTVHVRTPGIRILPLPLGDTTQTIVERLTLEAWGEAGTTLDVFGNPLTIVRDNSFISEAWYSCLLAKGGAVVEHNRFNKLDPYSGPTFSVVSGLNDRPGELVFAYDEVRLTGHGFVIMPELTVTKGSVHHNTIVYQPFSPQDPTTTLCLMNPGLDSLVISSNIFYGCIFFCNPGGGGESVIRNSCFYPAWDPPDGSCVPFLDPPNLWDVDPLLCDVGWDTWDWRLQPDSPCIGTGENGTNMGAPLGVGCGPIGVAAAGSGPRGLLRVVPNPTNGAAEVLLRLSDATDAVLGVFDATGRRVATVPLRPQPAGTRVVPWAGTDATGRRLPAGVYFLRLEADEGRSVAKVVIGR